MNRIIDIDEIKNKLNIKEKILFLTQTGSTLYGTNSENSDLDIKGVFLPNIEDLILIKAPRFYSYTSSKDNQKNTKDDVDITVYSLQYFLELVSKGETNALDLLYAYTNKNAVIFKDEYWNNIINNIDKLITKNVKSYLGFCISQSMKYSFKGEKLNNYNCFKSFLVKYLKHRNEDGNHILLNEAISKEFGKSFITLPTVPAEGKNRIKVNEFNNEFNFGEHCYFETSFNKETYITISDVKFELTTSVNHILSKLNRVINSYGERSQRAAEDNGADYKALSHAVRVLFQAEELLTKGKVTFPIKNTDFVKSIKYKETELTFDDIVGYLKNKISDIEEHLIPNSKLREKTDFKTVKSLILNAYK